MVGARAWSTGPVRGPGGRTRWSEGRRRRRGPGGSRPGVPIPAHRRRRSAPRRVAAEGRDRLVDPAQGGELVAQARVGGGVREESVALDAEPVVDRHEHHAVTGEGVPVVHGHRGGAPGAGPTAQPQQDGRRASGDGSGVHNVQVETVVAGHHRVGEVLREGVGVRRLGGRRPEGDGVAHAVPRLGRGGGPEAARSERRRRVRVPRYTAMPRSHLPRTAPWGVPVTGLARSAVICAHRPFTAPRSTRRQDHRQHESAVTHTGIPSTWRRMRRSVRTV